MLFCRCGRFCLRVGTLSLAIQKYDAFPVTKGRQYIIRHILYTNSYRVIMEMILAIFFILVVYIMQ